VVSHPEFSGDRVATESLEAGDCYLITDAPRYWERKIAGSPFNLTESAEAVTHYRKFNGYVLWVCDYLTHRYDGLAVTARSLKIQSRFNWELVGWAESEEGNALIYWMTEPPWGMTEAMDLPESKMHTQETP
jgi:hypothetical protein